MKREPELCGGAQRVGVPSGGIEWSGGLDFWWVSVGKWSLRVTEERVGFHGPLAASVDSWVWRPE